MRLVDRIVRFRLLFVLVFAGVFAGAMVSSVLLAKRGPRLAETLLVWGAALVLIQVGLWLVRRREAPLQRRLREADFGLCPGCGYPTEGRRGPICPECGDTTPPSQTRTAWEKRLGAWWPAVFDERR